jgi:hypothetical protein
MSDQPEVIRQQMEETRAALAEKVKTLEHQVVDTVAEANTAVVETVETVKEAVQGTVEAVKGTVEDTVESVKNTLDFSQQWDRHPWFMMGGAVALGYLGGCFLGKARSMSSRDERHGQRYVSPAGRAAEGGSNGNRGFGRAEGAFGSAPAQSSEPGWLSGLGETFSTEIDQLKALAIGTSLALIRDLIVQGAPDPLRPSVTELMNSVTTKLVVRHF